MLKLKIENPTLFWSLERLKTILSNPYQLQGRKALPSTPPRAFFEESDSHFGQRKVPACLPERENMRSVETLLLGTGKRLTSPAQNLFLCRTSPQRYAPLTNFLVRELLNYPYKKLRFLTYESCLFFRKSCFLVLEKYDLRRRQRNAIFQT